MDRDRLKNELIAIANKLIARAQRFNLNTRFNYLKVKEELAKETTVIETLDDLRKVNFVEDAIFDKFHRAYHRTAPERPRGAARVRVNERYQPVHRSVAYTLLKVLFLEDGITKHILVRRGLVQAASRIDFDLRHSTALGSLVRKAVVAKEGRPARYYLTDHGRAVCERAFVNFSFIEPGEERVTLFVDSREVNTRRGDREFFKRVLGTVNVATRNLEVGDFVWMMGEKVLNYIVERKTGSDFVSSILDGRLREQKRRLLGLGIDNVFYVIENLTRKDKTRVGEALCMSCLHSLQLSEIVVFETPDIAETAKLILRIHEKVVAEYGAGDQKENLGETQEEGSAQKAKFIDYDSYVMRGTKSKCFGKREFLKTAFTMVRGLSVDQAERLTEAFGCYRVFISHTREAVLAIAQQVLVGNLKARGSVLESMLALMHDA